MARIYLNPSKSFMDGKLTFNGALLANFRFNSMSSKSASTAPADKLLSMEKRFRNLSAKTCT